ncbi:hypothetical protein Hanom_Chr11g00982301 [Helianthus anomalus]
MYWFEKCWDLWLIVIIPRLQKSWTWESCDNDTNIGIRAKGSFKIKEEGSEDRLMETRIKSSGIDSSDAGSNSGNYIQCCNKGKYVAQGKPSTLSWKSFTKKFPKKMVPNNFSRN